MTSTLQDVYDRLYATFGPQFWWPGQSPTEVLIGAVLVQNTAWKNVEKAIENLREAGLLSIDRLAGLHLEELAELIRPAGYFRLKSRRLSNLLKYVVDAHGGSLERMFRRDTSTLREELLGINGIGPETADSILLYAGQKPVFVVDTYTHRVMARHGWIGFDADYAELQSLFADGLHEDAALFNEYHALLVRVGHEFCRKTPRCEACPLSELLPEGRPQEPPWD